MENTENTMVNTTATTACETTAYEEYEPKGLAAVLNKFFHFKEKGSTMKNEIFSGIAVFLVSVVVLLVNTRIIASTLGQDNAGYCGTYLAATIVSFIGTLFIGLFCNLPLTQTSSLSMSTSFVALIGASKGLTYYNLLAISFISALIYVALMAIPVVKEKVLAVLPEPVKKALPIGMGIYIVYYALTSLNVVSASGTTLTVNALTIDAMGSSMYVAGAIGAIIALVACAVLYILGKSANRPVYYAVILGTLGFFIAGLVYGFSQIYSVDRAYIMVGAENQYTIAMGFQGLEFGKVFTNGFDFSAYDGNAFQIVLFGILSFLCTGMLETRTNTAAAMNEAGVELDAKTENKVLLASAITNVVAPLFGTTPVTVSKQSTAATTDGGKTGLVSVTASIGYIVAMFTWLFFAIFATFTQTVTDYGHATSNSFAEYTQAAFGVIDGIMIFVAILMVKGAIAKLDVANAKALAVSVVTAILLAVTQNIVLAVFAGIVLDIAIKLLTFKKDEIKTVSIESAAFAVILLVTLLLK